MMILWSRRRGMLMMVISQQEMQPTPDEVQDSMTIPAL
jgi:hypothetical protein